MVDLQDQAIRQHCKTLRMPTIGGQFARLAEAAAREGQSHVGYLEALLAAEMEERESRAIGRLLHEARLPRMKTLDGFEFDRSGVSAAQLRALAEGDYVAKAEPVLLVGEAGTGKTHLATGLCVAACRQRRRVRFATASALINELAEAAHANQLSRALGRWERLDLICIDELGYVPLAETACELMFQVIADRAEKAAVIVTTNLPFSEWSQVIPNPRLCKALIDRLTDQAHIITTGAEFLSVPPHHGAAQGRQNVKRETEKRTDPTMTVRAVQPRRVGQNSSAQVGQNSWTQPRHVIRQSLHRCFWLAHRRCGACANSARSARCGGRGGPRGP